MEHKLKSILAISDRLFLNIDSFNNNYVIALCCSRLVIVLFVFLVIKKFIKSLCDSSEATLLPI